MYTSATLLEIAAAAEAEYERLSKLFPAGTIHDGRNEARRRMEQALSCAHWMEKMGHKALAYVGPFGTLPFKRKSRVRIRKGALVHSLHPQSKGTAPSKASQVVTVHFVDAGFVNFVDTRDGEVRQPRITWAGAGGYWRSVDANEVELVEELVAAPVA